MTHKNFSEVIFLLFSHHNDKELFEITVKENAKAITGVFARLSLYAALGLACLIYLMPFEHSASMITTTGYYLWVIAFLFFGAFHRSNTDGKKQLLIILGSIFYGASSINFSDFLIFEVLKFFGLSLCAFIMSAILSICLALRRYFNAIIEQPEYDREFYSSYLESLQAESASEAWFDPLNDMWCNRLSEDEEFALRLKFNDVGRLDDYINGDTEL